MNNLVYPAKLDTLYQAIDHRQSQNGQPLIGISANFENGNSCIEHSYVISILQAGAIPVLLPVHNDIETLRNTVEQLDGLMLTGGGDINPLYGNEEPLPPLRGIDAARDQFDFTLVKLAADRQIPIFGICRGHQIINMAFGGTNYQDIYSQNEQQLLKHSQSISREYGSHTVNVEKKHRTSLRTWHGFPDREFLPPPGDQGSSSRIPGKRHFSRRDRGSHGRYARSPRIQRAMAPGENGCAPRRTDDEAIPLFCRRGRPVQESEGNSPL